MSSERIQVLYVLLRSLYRHSLVGAPPVSIASYGGETDNVECLAKGDFALYRVYGGKTGNGFFSEINVPIVPKKVLSISTKGLKREISQ